MNESAPTTRRLRAYAFDPATAPAELDRYVANELVLKVPWEGLTPGPVGEYVEVIDHDPASGCFYLPVDLDHPFVLAQGGLAPAQGDPLFHQQATYALVMATVREFERGLGRWVLWSPRSSGEEPGRRLEFVRRLRVHPHALREASAYYSPARKALLMGYFRTAVPGDGSTDATAFTCLSPGVVACETAHAVLDGLHRAVSPSDGGTEELAVQEAIADVVALLQQLAIPGFLASRIAFTSDLERNRRRLEELARQLAQPVGMQALLRSRIGATASTQPPGLPTGTVSHRAALLVAALFEAFMLIGLRRCAGILAVAGVGVGERRAASRELSEGIASELARSASHVLQMCLRAIDYCPPVDVTCGDYLRAMVTADADLVGEDEAGYRLALVEAFRRGGLHPPGRGNLSPPDLLWRPPTSAFALDREWGTLLEPGASRQDEFARERRRCDLLSAALSGGEKGPPPEALREMGLAVGDDAPRTIARAARGSPLVRVDSFRLAWRAGPRGAQRCDWVITVSQERRGWFDPAIQEAQDRGEPPEEKQEFSLRGGCTLVVDARTLQVRHCIAKDVLSKERLGRVAEALLDRGGGTRAGEARPVVPAEPFLAIRGGGPAAPGAGIPS